METADVVKTLDLMDLIAGGEIPEVDDPQEIKLSIVRQILAAETEEEVFAAGGSTSCQDMVNVALTLKDVKVMRSDIQDTLAVYVLLDCEIMDTGKPIVLNTSAARAMAQAWRAKELGLLPKKVQVVEVAKAKPGQSAPLGLAVI